MSVSETRFSKTHEWARPEGDEYLVGITDYAVQQLNREIVFVDLPSVGKTVCQGDVFGVVEAVKTAADLYAPLSGTITAVNTAVQDDPNLLAHEPEGAGWLIRIKASSPSDFNNLLTKEQYRQHLAEGGEH